MGRTTVLRHILGRASSRRRKRRRCQLIRCSVRALPDRRRTVTRRRRQLLQPGDVSDGDDCDDVACDDVDYTHPRRHRYWRFPSSFRRRNRRSTRRKTQPLPRFDHYTGGGGPCRRRRATRTIQPGLPRSDQYRALSSGLPRPRCWPRSDLVRSP